MNKLEELEEYIDTLSKIGDNEVTFGLIVTKDKIGVVKDIKEHYQSSTVIELKEPDYEGAITKTLNRKHNIEHPVFLVPNNNLNNRTLKQLYDLKNSVLNTWIPGEQKRIIREIKERVTLILIIDEKEFNEPFYSKISESVQRI